MPIWHVSVCLQESAAIVWNIIKFGTENLYHIMSRRFVFELNQSSMLPTQSGKTAVILNCLILTNFFIISLH